MYTPIDVRRGPGMRQQGALEPTGSRGLANWGKEGLSCLDPGPWQEAALRNVTCPKAEPGPSLLLVSWLWQLPGRELDLPPQSTDRPRSRAKAGLFLNPRLWIMTFQSWWVRPGHSGPLALSLTGGYGRSGRLDHLAGDQPSWCTGLNGGP